MKGQPSHRSALTRSTQVANLQNMGTDPLADTTSPTQQRILWIDGVGGFLLLDADEIMIGQATPHNQAEVLVVGDLSRQSAAIRRNGGDYLIQPLQPTRINGQLLDRPQLLSDDTTIHLGDRVQLSFFKPNPLSATARLQLSSLHRFKPSVDGVLLLADSCILGPNAGSHVVCPSWKDELLMYRHGNDWFFRALEEIDVDGKPLKGQIPLTSGLRMQGDDFSLSIE